MNPVDAKPSVLEIREALRREFETWLNSALAEERPPAGMTADLMTAMQEGGILPPVEGRCDLYSLWSALTALTQEIKLQSRTFKQVNDTLAQLAEAVATAIRQNSVAEVMDAAEPEQKQESEAGSAIAHEHHRDKRYVDLLLDLRDRLERGLNSVAEARVAFLTSARRSKWARWFGTDDEQQSETQEVLSALEKGYVLTRDRLDQALGDYHVYPIDCQGKEFNSHLMTAVDLEETDAVAEGTVVGVYRAGYEWEGEVYRSAQVKVARRKLNHRQVE